MRPRLPLAALVPLLLVLLLGPALRAATTPSPLPLDAAERTAREIHALLAAALGAPDPTQPSLGPKLAAYARLTGTAPERHENTEAAARRLLASGATPLLAPDLTSLRLIALADSLLTSLHTLDSTRTDLRPDRYVPAAPALRATALLAKFHARRLLAAVHYNLFLRGQRLAELYAATLDTKTALDLWRELVAVVGERAALTFGTPPFTFQGAWRAELTRLEFDYKDLEAMCCPPDESWLHEKVWSPAK